MIADMKHRLAILGALAACAGLTRANAQELFEGDIFPQPPRTERVVIEGTAGDFLYVMEPKRKPRPVILMLPAVAGDQRRSWRYDTNRFPRFLSDKGYSVAWIAHGYRHPKGEEDLAGLIRRAMAQIEKSAQRF